MLTIAVVSQKGGAGKTTVVVHLAVAAQLAGERVAVLDTDPQGSASAWAKTRGSSTPMVVDIDPSDVSDALAAAKEDEYSLVLIDTAPRAEPIAAATCRAADFVLVPVRPSAFDLHTVEQTAAIITAAGKGSSSAIVLNACPARAPEVAEARSFCEGLAIPLATTELGDRRAFARAVQTGRAVQEFEPSSAAAAEMIALWLYVKERLSNVQP
jgi:chromosome partitioning protein